MKHRDLSQTAQIINERYQVEKQLGVGGMGEVLLIRDLFEKKPTLVALKLLNVEDKKNTEVLDWFKREFHTLTTLHHPGLARVFDFGRDHASGRAFYTTEYIDGEDLFVATRDKKLEEILPILLRISQAIDYIHSKGVLHNDLKTSNILVERSTNHPKVLDFGLSYFHLEPKGKKSTPKDKTNFFLGTVNYAAPELLLGEAASFQTDLFALGMVFYKVLAGKMPHTSKSRREIAQQNLEAKFPSPSTLNRGLPNALETLVLKLLSKNPKNRPQNVGEVISALALVSGTWNEISSSETVLPYAEHIPMVGRERPSRLLQRYINGKIPKLSQNEPTEVLDKEASSFGDLAWEELDSQETGFAILHGGIGLGKSFFINHLKHRYQLLEVPFILSDPKKDPSAFQPWKRIFAEIRATLDGDSEVVKDYAVLFDYLDATESETKRSNLDRTGFFFMLCQFLIHVFAKHPFILALDNTESLDEVSRDFLVYLNRLQDQTNVKAIPPMILAFRSREFAQQLLQGKRNSWVALEALSQHDSLHLLEKIFTGSRVEEAFAQAIYEKSGGNPFFLQQLVRDLIASEVIERKSGKWNLSQINLKSLRTPPTLDELLTKRLNRLPETQKNLLTVAAIVQEPIHEALLQSLLKESLEHIREALTSLTQEDILRLEEEKSWTFSQTTLADLILKTITNEKAKHLHLQFANYLENQTPKPSAKLARHYAFAEESVKACAFAMAGAREAQHLFALEQAHELYQLTLTQVPLDPDSKKFEIPALGGLADIYWRRGNHPLARETYETLLAKSEPGEWLTERIQAFRALGIACRNRTQYDRAIEYFQNALHELGGKSPDIKAALCAQIAIVYERLENRPLIQEWSEKALALISRKNKFQADAVPVLLILAGIAVNIGNLEEGKVRYRKALEIARIHQDVRSIAIALNNLGAIAAREGRFSEALEILQESLGLCRKIHDTIRTCHCLNLLGKVEYRQGNFRKAVSHLLEALDLSINIDDFSLTKSIQTTLGQIESDRGNYQLAEKYFEAAKQVCLERKDAKGILMIQLSYANLNLLLGKNQEAKDLALRNIDKSKDPSEQNQALLIACQASLHMKDYSAAQHLLNQAKERFSALPSPEEKLFFYMTKADWFRRSGNIAGAHEAIVEINSQKKTVSDPLLQHRCKLLELRIRLEFQHAQPKSTGQFKNLLAQATQLAVSLATHENLELLWQTHYLVAELFEETEEMRQAIESYKKSRETFLHMSSDLPGEDRQIYLSDPDKQKVMSKIDRLSQTSEFMSEELKNAQQLIDQMFRLLSINQEIAAGWQNRGHLMEYILDTALEFSQSKHGFIILKETDQKWQVAAERAKANESDENDFDLQHDWSRSIVDEVVRTGRAKAILDAGRDPELRESNSVHKLQIKSILCVPLKLGLKVLGVLYLDHGKVAENFSKTIIDLLSSLADQAALSLMQSETHERLIQSVEETSSELKRARVLVQQQSKSLEWKYSYAKIIGGKASNMKRVFDLLDRVIPTHSSVLIQGESGTGKELIAQAIHYNGPRKEKPFISINCAGLNPTLLESELFGHVKGAFTGAEGDRDGLFLLANGGSIFLDEIADMPLDVQAKLLRTLQEGEIRPLGSDQIYHVNVRIISASNKPLHNEVELSRFRKDFFYRLNVVQIDLPALRDRLEDLDLLMDQFIRDLTKKRKGRTPKLTTRARQALHIYRWPGNIRELYNTLEGIIALHHRKTIDLDNLPQHIREAGKKERGEMRDLESSREEFTRQYLRKLYTQTAGSISEAARIAGVYRQSMYRMLERYEIIKRK